MIIIKKLIHIDLINVLLCFMVIFIHVSSETISQYPKDRGIYLLIFICWKLVSFAVPAFIFISGFKVFLSKRILDMPYLEYLRKRVVKILIPYLLWVMIYYIYFLDHGFFKPNVLELLKYILLGNLVSHFYFVVIIFQFYLLLPVWKQMMQLKGIVIISLMITIIAKYYFMKYHFIYMDRIFLSYLVYWILGCFFGKYYHEISNKMARYRGLIIGAYILFTSFYMLKSVNQAIHQKFFAYAEYWHIVFCLLSILGIYCIAIKLCRSEMIGKITQLLSPTTFLVYLSHVLFIFILNNILNQYNLSPLHRYTIRIIIIYPVVFCFAYYFSVFRKHQNKEIMIQKS